jgi:basic membrane protein A and related proteins
MNSKRFLPIIAVILTTTMLLGLAACSPAPAPAPAAPAAPQQVEVTRIVEKQATVISTVVKEVVVTSTPAPEQKEDLGNMQIKAALVMPGVHTDFGWNYVAFEALSNLISTLPANITRIDYTELVEPGDAEKVLRDYIAAGYNLIFVHGYQYKEGVDKVMADKPKNVYIVIVEGTQADLIDGSVSFISPEGNGASYVLGTLAAGMSNNKNVGIISGMESVDVNRNVAGYKAGVEAFGNGTKVGMTIVGNWDDPSAGKKAAEAMMTAGVDVIYCMGDGTSIGVIQGVSEAQKAGKKVFYIGYPSDQHAAFSDIVLTSIVYNFKDSFLNQAKDVLLGKFGKQGYAISLGKGVSIAPFYQFEDTVPADLKATMADKEAAILKGSITVPR